MSGKRYRHFVNNLLLLFLMYGILRLDLGKDLLLYTAIYGNKVSAVCVDNWSQFGNVREEFCNNAERCTNEDTQLELQKVTLEM